MGVGGEGWTVRSVHTYSIVARDAETGEMGVAVQSHYFSVGPVVPWAEAGVGAVATQSMVRVDYGPEGLALMREGYSAPEALRVLLAADPEREVRQVAMVDASGQVAAHTGSRCIAAAGHLTGDGFSVQANLMLDDSVCPAMREAFEATEGPLAERLVASLVAAQEVGGDIRGQQSAALLVVAGEKQAQPWRGRVLELRVEDHPQPVEELQRLLRLHRAYNLATRSNELTLAGDHAEARAALSGALELVTENDELKFWAALSRMLAGREEEGLQLFREVFARAPIWAELVPRLVAAGRCPDDPDLIERILGTREQAGNT
jgi:uncharacterized Ntn-hydrolase superfamily protein